VADSPGSQRAISPVLGVVLLVAVVLALAAVTGGILLGLGEEPEPAPEVVLALSGEDAGPGERYLVHEQGERLDGDDLRLRGVADPEGLAGETVTAADRHRVVPTDRTVEVVWVGDQGRTYRLREFSVDPAAVVPQPDEGCEWVDDESGGGTDGVAIDGVVVNCDVETDREVTVQDGAVIGDTTSGTKYVDADGAQFYGSIEVEESVDIHDGEVSGGVTASSENLKLRNTSVGGTAAGGKLVEVLEGSAVEGDVTSDTKGAKVVASEVSGEVTAAAKVDVDDGVVGGPVETDGEIEVTAASTVGGDLVSDADQIKVLDSTVDGSVATDGVVKLENATIESHVYADGTDFDCTDSTVNGQDCSSYAPRDPDGY